MIAQTTEAELDELKRLAKIANGGSIVEIGALFGATTLALCQAAPDSLVTTFDKFIHSEGVKSSPEILRNNLKGVNNFKLCVRDTLSVKKWEDPIALLFIDGAHDYGHVLHDLSVFGPNAQTIAMHDYGARAGAVVRAADAFFRDHREFGLVNRVRFLAVFERGKHASRADNQND
jgi:predicted O-methyltransferase YrrM